jgi:hypothetical protein
VRSLWFIVPAAIAIAMLMTYPRHDAVLFACSFWRSLTTSTLVTPPGCAFGFMAKRWCRTACWRFDIRPQL